MTLNGHFTLNFHYYEQLFEELFYILAVESISRIFLLYHVTSKDMRFVCVCVCVMTRQTISGASIDVHELTVVSCAPSIHIEEKS